MAEITVTSTADSGAGSLRQAIFDARDGDVILFDSTVFPVGTTTAILLSTNIAINKEIVIDAGSHESQRRVALDAQGAGRCLYLQNAAKSAVVGIEFRNASQPGNGGAVYCGSTRTCFFVNCAFTGNTGNTGGGASTTVAAALTFDRCEFTNNTANANGGAVYGGNGAELTFDRCEFSGNACTQDSARRGVLGTGTCAVVANATNFDALYIYGTGSIAITGGVTTVSELTATAGLDVTIQDGAALAVTTDAAIPSDVTFTSPGRAYLATATGLDFSAATLTNVVACSYGAGASAFWEDLGVLRWDAADVTVPVLLEVGSESNGATQWETLIQTTGNSYTRYFPPHVNLRLFDGEKFLTTSTPDSRTYYYIGGAEGSFAASADWSLTRGGSAITEAPTVKDCTFIIGDVAAPTEEETTPTEETGGEGTGENA